MIMKHINTIIYTLSIILVSCNFSVKSDINQENLYSYDVETRLDSLNIVLRTPAKPVANFVKAVKTGNLIFLSGSGPKDVNGNYIKGKVGNDLTVAQGYETAKLIAIEQLSVLKAELGDLNKVVKIVKVLGMVNADSTFTQHPEVINGFSDTMVQVFGERGKHARAAVGMASLPRNIACEIEMVVEFRE